MNLKKGTYHIFINTIGDGSADENLTLNEDTDFEVIDSMIKSRSSDYVNILCIWNQKTNSYYFYKGKYTVKYWDCNLRMKNRIISLETGETFKDLQKKLYAKEPDANRVYSVKIKGTKHEISPSYTQEELGLKL